uniref:protein mono-ADP-ribosyltransferase PARP8-like isoform X2 n=1 Tax=Myxine glutinosa TaxID=7769 RepID=UPI00358E0E03
MESVLKTFLESRWKRSNVPPNSPPKKVKRRHIVSRFLKRAHSLFKSTYQHNHNKEKKIPIQDYTLLPISEQGILLEVMHHITKEAEELRGLHMLFDAPCIPEDKVLESTVCIRDTCNAPSQRMPGPIKAEMEVSTSAEVLDLLLVAALFSKSHLKSRKNPSVIVPYPTIVHPKNPNTLAFHPGNNKKRAKFKQTLRSIPSPKTMAQWSSMQIKQHLEKKDPLAYPLLKWIIESVGFPIVKLPASQQLPFMCTRHQFLFLTAPSNREVEFILARRKYGSTFAFHGSPIGNWHSIIHQGLLVKSDTPQQRNGAMFGAGIYLSPLYNTACSYSDIDCMRFRNVKPRPFQHQSEELFMSTRTLKCIALCEETSRHLAFTSRGHLHPPSICV